jgi:glycosyltransferase involved in cell wall biosynthesis
MAKFSSALYKKGTLVVADGLGDEKDEYLTIIDLGKPSNRIARFILQLKVMYSLRLRNFDIFHLHDPELLFVGFLLKLFNKKVVYDIHELVFHDIIAKQWIPFYSLRFFVASFYNVIESIAVSAFDSIILAEDGYKKHYYSLYPDKVHKFEVINNYPILPESNEFRKDEFQVFTLIYVGSLSENRGILELIRALDKVNQPVQLILVGKWVDESYFIKCKSEFNWKFVSYEGHHKPKAVRKYILKSNLGICTLYSEENYLYTTPVKTFEYISFGIPILMSDFPFWIEFYEKYAHFCNPKSPEDIASSINRLLCNNLKLYNELKVNCITDKKKFNWGKEFDKLIALYLKND